jgi:hypothetical protein
VPGLVARLAGEARHLQSAGQGVPVVGAEHPLQIGQHGGEQVPRGRRVADLPGETREPLPSGQGVRVVRAEHSGPSACRPIPSRTARPERRHMATAWHSRKSGASHGKESTASSERMLSPPYNVFDPPTAYSANAWPGDV